MKLGLGNKLIPTTHQGRGPRSGMNRASCVILELTGRGVGILWNALTSAGAHLKKNRDAEEAKMRPKLSTCVFAIALGVLTLLSQRAGMAQGPPISRT